MKTLIITGGSSGIGNGIVEVFLKKGWEIFSISRSPTSIPLTHESSDHGAIFQVIADLSNMGGWVTDYEVVLDNVQESKELVLIHNAGTLSPMGLMGKGHKSRDIQQAIQLNVSTPLFMTERFLQVFQENAMSKKVVFISSGAGRKPYEGWGTYCASKAALDHFTRVLHAEQGNMEHPVKVSAVAPGVVDTPMQTKIREQDATSFPNVQRFKDLKKDGKLWTPEFVGEELYEFLAHPGFGKEPIMDLRTWREEVLT
ncbi:MAG: SDR family NAD(P)-dependent oxidoreductase [Bacteroidota bacterium]